MKFSRLLIFLSLLLNACGSPELSGVPHHSDDTVTIGYAEGLSNYSPLSYEAKNRRYLANIYESLVRYDATFNLETSLALSWGRLDDYTWDFHLRQDVLFHDGTVFDADDVIYSIQMAQEQKESELAALLSTVIEVKKTDDYQIEIITSQPDPLLLNKLTCVYMFPSAYVNFDSPNGTGPYRMSEYTDDTLILERFENYWGPLAYFKEAHLRTISDPDERLEAMKKREIQILANIPPQYVSDLESTGIMTLDFHSLEVSFLMLNQNGPFADVNLRAVVWNALSTDYVNQFGGGYLLPTSQFAAGGITGYNAAFSLRQKDLKAAAEYRALLPEVVDLDLYIPEELQKLGVAVQEDLAAIDITVHIHALPDEDYADTIAAGTADFYFFGWKYDLADIGDFFDAVVHTKTGSYGAFNFFSYSNPDVDAMIEQASTLLDTAQRRLLLDQISGLLLRDYIAVPLFESQVLYAISPELRYNFRLDGQILASEIVKNVVK